MGVEPVPPPQRCAPATFAERLADLEEDEACERQDIELLCETSMPIMPSATAAAQPAMIDSARSTAPKCGSSSIGYATDHASSPAESASNSWSSTPACLGGVDLFTKRVGGGAAAKACKKCARDFSGSMRKKYICRFCGDGFCTYCAQCRVGLFDADGRLKQTRVCESCTVYHNIGVAPGFAASPQHTALASARTITPRMSISASATTTPHTARESQRDKERIRELQAEVDRLKESMSTLADQDYLGKKARALERDKVTRRKRLFARNEHHRSKCQICLTTYSLFTREHHCRACYRSVCDVCSKARIEGQRHCDWCVSAPPAELPACATGPLAASRAAEYQHAADLLWKLSQQESADYREETPSMATLQRINTGSVSNFSLA